MAIQKKSLITNLSATKKALVVNSAPEITEAPATTSEPKVSLKKTALRSSLRQTALRASMRTTAMRKSMRKTALRKSFKATK